MADLLERLKAALSDRYTIERELGRGGMATVYLAQDRKLGREIALKVLRPEIAASLGAERFLREIEIAAKLSHPNILPLHDRGEADGQLYYTMPLVEGESLRDRLEREKQLPLEDALRITREVADALSYAHSRGVVHRDIKPENILFVSRHAVVADFGIARAVIQSGGESLTETGLAVGTPAYMSPEQGAGDRDVDGRSDLYSLACVLYEMLGGEPPHTGPTPQAIMVRKLSDEVRSLRPIRSGVTSELEAAINRALARTPADRYATCEDFISAIEAPGSVVASVARKGGLRRRHVAGLIVLAIAAAVVYFGARWMISPSPTAVDRLGIAVFPFRPTGGGAEEWSEALADLLATALDGTPGVRVADPWSLWSPLRVERGARAESPDPASAERLALRAGASRYVLGSAAVLAGNQLNVTLRLYEVGADQPVNTSSESAPLDSLPSLVDRLAVGLIGRIWSAADRPAVRAVESYATLSVDALKAYLRAREAMRRGHVEEAEAAIDSALGLDSTFALALVEAIRIRSWATSMRGELFDLMDLAERAQRHGDSLSERWRLSVAAMVASVRTDGSAAADAVGRILEIDSTDFIAWNDLAYYHLAYGWQYGKDERDALRAAERAVRLDSTYVPSLMMRAKLALWRGDSVDIDRQLERLWRADSSNVLVRGMLAAFRSVLASDSAFTSIIDTIAVAPPPEWIPVYKDLRMSRPDRAHMLIERIRHTGQPGISARAAEGEEARLWIAEGRTQFVDSLIEAGRYRRDNLFRTLQHYLVAATLAGVGNQAVAARAVNTLAEYIPVDSAAAYSAQHDVWWTGWLIGAYHAMFGDTGVTRDWQSALGQLEPGGTSKDYRGALQRDLEARIAARNGDIQRALDLEHEAYDLWTIHTGNDQEVHPGPAIRFQLGMLLREAGRPDSAAVLLRSVCPPVTWMGFFTARASLELGALSEERGDLDAAAEYYALALGLWERGDQEVSDWRDDVRARLQRVLRRRG